MAEVRSALWKNWIKILSYLARRSGLSLVRLINRSQGEK